MMNTLKYFNDNDFATADPACGISDMDPVFLEKLDEARGLAETPFIVNSGFRTVAHEKAQGRDGTSSHTKGLAVDLKATTSRQRFRVISGLLKAGFSRIGVGKTFIHVDDDKQKAQAVAWHYYKS